MEGARIVPRIRGRAYIFGNEAAERFSFYGMKGMRNAG
jgi:dipeptide/tripeptide permease